MHYIVFEHTRLFGNYKQKIFISKKNAFDYIKENYNIEDDEIEYNELLYNIANQSNFKNDFIVETKALTPYGYYEMMILRKNCLFCRDKYFGKYYVSSDISIEIFVSNEDIKKFGVFNVDYDCKFVDCISYFDTLNDAKNFVQKGIDEDNEINEKCYSPNELQCKDNVYYYESCYNIRCLIYEFDIIDLEDEKKCK